MRVYVTGGSGLLGSHLSACLRERGHDVVCLLRPESQQSFLRGIGCEVREGDVRAGVEALAPGMVGADAVVHAAAMVYTGGPWPRLRAVNVEGTAHVLRAARAAGVPQAVHVSSVAVYGGAPGPVDESTPTDTPIPPGNLYARSKREAEAQAREVDREGGLALSIVRPAALYGERDRLLSPKLARVVGWPLVPLLGRGDNTLPIVYAGNAADAVARVLEARVGRVYDIGFDGPLTQRALLEGMAETLGRRPRFVAIPGALVRLAASLGGALGLAVPGAGDLTLERVARLSLDENPFPTLRIRRELGWEPPVGHDEALRRTGAWFAAGGRPAGVAAT